MNKIGIEESVIFNLTGRETEVLKLASVGLVNKEIACKLDISKRTVEKHLGNAYCKLCAKNKTEAVTIAIKNNCL